jgi:hypothetical protein
MFKVGDYIILIKGDAEYMDYLIGVPCKITKIVGEYIYHDKIDVNKCHYFIPSDTFNVIPAEVIESPLFRLMKEEE